MKDETIVITIQPEDEKDLAELADRYQLVHGSGPKGRNKRSFYIRGGHVACENFQQEAHRRWGYC
jgi:hypothetical protein